MLVNLFQRYGQKTTICCLDFISNVLNSISDVIITCTSTVLWKCFVNMKMNPKVSVKVENFHGWMNNCHPIKDRTCSM